MTQLVWWRSNRCAVSTTRDLRDSSIFFSFLLRAFHHLRRESGGVCQTENEIAEMVSKTIFAVVLFSLWLVANARPLETDFDGETALLMQLQPRTGSIHIERAKNSM